MSVSEQHRNASPDGVNWQARCNIARSLLNHRPASALTAMLAANALDGYGVEDLMRIEREHLARIGGA